MKFGATQAYQDAVKHAGEGTTTGWVELAAGVVTTAVGIFLLCRGSNWHGKALQKVDDCMALAELDVPAELEEELMKTEEEL